MIFYEVFGAYYNAVARILAEATDGAVNLKRVEKIAADQAFGDSRLLIGEAIKQERWQIITREGTTTLKHEPTMPVTMLEKRWLKSIYMDPRIGLFVDEVPEMPGVEPLFRPEDVVVYDKYTDGDPYKNENYVRNFRQVLSAVKGGYPLSIQASNRSGDVYNKVIMPDKIEYSEKDDKFRLIGRSELSSETVNMARIISCSRFEGKFTPVKTDTNGAAGAVTGVGSGAAGNAGAIGASGTDRGTEDGRHCKVELELTDERNALERVLLHFAYFEKEAERIDDKRYKLRITYDKDDEAELVIRVLSFGPVLRVTAPEEFAGLIKERLMRQKSCGM